MSERPAQWLVDGGYRPGSMTLKMPRGHGTTVYAPVPKPKDPES